ncbi:hypothetical protein [Peredibacter starrii]|uniref:B box-type domain-containing protein n=1 Tax=Peredibacter starrii TaxID=28202 RepID=A0AAX4HQ71_9BACT|nr:hypothetical protein [Peredibacter starrii]WPU65488.1 hypothetical protein SOO65_01885 [Peredibacter starrii]
MEQTALVLISIMNLLLVIILGVLGFLIYRLFQQKLPTQKQPETTADPNYHPDIMIRMKEMEKLKPKRSDLFCPNHPDEPGETTCAICDRLFCKACIRPFKTLHFCKEHLPLIMKNDWEEVFTLKTSTHDPEEGVRLYDAKKRLFEDKNIPTYVETHYKINVDQDYIETYLVVYSIPENTEIVRENLQ